MRKMLKKSLLSAFSPLPTLDSFAIAGLFANWWQEIKYDIKAIQFSGWNETMITDTFIINEFFQSQKSNIDVLESKILEAETMLTDVLDTIDYDDDDGKTASKVKTYLK